MKRTLGIYITAGMFLYVLFGFALLYSVDYWTDLLNMRPVVKGQNTSASNNQNGDKEASMFGDYKNMRGVSMGELNQSVGDRFYLSWPVKDDLGVVTQCFSEDHQAIDIAHYTYPKILAVADGEVLKAGCLDAECPEGVPDEDGMGLARTVMIKHENGLISLYGHLKSISVEEGDTITRGDEIGEMGKSGDTISISASGEGVHLHFALLLNDDWIAINPAPYFREDFCDDGDPDPEAYFDPVDDTVYDEFDFQTEFSNPSTLEIEPEPVEEIVEEETEIDGLIRIDNDDEEDGDDTFIDPPEEEDPENVILPE